MFPAINKLGYSHFGASTFFASAHPSESCGSNGLPLTPNSIRILGCARALYTINHPNLCTYIDVLRGKHERIIVIQEYYRLNLRTACEKYENLRTEECLIKFSFDILQGLLYLNKFGTVCRNLSPDTILIDPRANLKLYGFGLYYMTEAGSTISFPIGTPKYLPPELLLKDCCVNEGQPSANCGEGLPAWDSWALGVILLELLLNVTFFEGEDLASVVETILSFVVAEKEFIDSIVEYHGCVSELKKLSPEVLDFICACLRVEPKRRARPCDLVSHPVFKCLPPSGLCDIASPHFPLIDPSLCLVDIAQYKTRLGIFERNFKDTLAQYPHGVEEKKEEEEEGTNKVWRFRDMDHLGEKSMSLVYFLWQLVGGNAEHELKRQKLIHTLPSVLTLPSLMAKEGEIFGGGFQRHELLPTDTIILPLENLRKRLAHIPVHKYYPLITQGECGTDDLDTSKLPLVIREKDVEYQFHKVLLFERLLKAYPYKLDAIIREARKDIPPYYRALIWAALLRVDGAVGERYEQVDKETPTSTDRQIEVDIPRCHQYDELLSSPQGHAKFTRILKAWVVSHPHLVYWQGLDSLCAPFLYLNFENEALAYDCLSAFITKYLHHFFLRDNSAVIQEYLAKFSHLIAFHDPQLFNHLHTIGFIPELYAIPWFLTMFTHVFPLHKIFLLWDTLLLGGSSLPLCVGVALLRQLKDRLLQFGFNECILLFSDMPDINMEQVVLDAVDIFCSTPSSVTFRQYDNTGQSKNQENSMFADKELLMEVVSLTELKEELCGRMSGAELLELMTQRRNSKGGRAKVLLLDVRPSEEFGRGSLPGSVSVPCDVILSPDGDFVPSSLLEVVSSFKGKILVVIGSVNAESQAVKVAHALLFQGFPRVCILHKGIEVFRTSGHLIVQSG